MSWHNVQRWRGVVLVGLAVIATLILAFSNQLVLYIHPRYVIFTVVMIVIALVFVVASLLLADRGDPEEPATRFSKGFAVAGLAIASLVAVSMIVLPPATLSSVTADQRDINSTALGASETTLEDAASASAATFSSFTVLDWASLLRQTSDVQFYADKPVDVVGFITADTDDPENVFYVSRFFVTCCAVDAQPTGIPVYQPGWSSTLSADDWVQVTGTFEANPSQGSTQPLALIPDQVTPTEQPSEPYLF
ncbi:putative membrane protein [Microbacteriaceae bacterium SG_E_30_P1]|uniref:Membrane protein n=1 Tax=Antiquaquibacter oligotrophicus TaxID=2880260 RepID=A0ABT6KMI5_9MICO|nr:TIGR03943 family protein [Antiquaquibacter oligotrophicus]MDH6181221.1 putative membrane protein [Antiquaquibacter oligotrophicus]UDF13084.1 TIGR03943 family protein [Antiquaquibacter oligotrophicus]